MNNERSCDCHTEIATFCAKCVERKNEEIKRLIGIIDSSASICVEESIRKKDDEIGRLSGILSEIGGMTEDDGSLEEAVNMACMAGMPKTAWEFIDSKRNEEEIEKWRKLAYELYVLSVYGAAGTLKQVAREELGEYAEVSGDKLYYDAKEIIAREYEKREKQ